MQNDKEPEMMSPANPSEATPSSQQDLVPSLEILDTEFNSRPIGEKPLPLSVPPATFHPPPCFIVSHHSVVSLSFHLTHLLLSVVPQWSGPDCRRTKHKKHSGLSVVRLTRCPFFANLLSESILIEQQGKRPQFSIIIIVNSSKLQGWVKGGKGRVKNT